MNIKVADYPTWSGPKEYDADAPCWCCGLPVISASASGTHVCSWCDCGKHRDGTAWTIGDADKAYKKYRESRENYNLGQERTAK
jgi:hypothetical protein